MNDTNPTTAFNNKADDGVAVNPREMFANAKKIGQDANAIGEHARSGTKTVKMESAELSKLASSRTLSTIVAEWVSKCAEQANTVAGTGKVIWINGQGYNDLDGNGAISMQEKKTQDYKAFQDYQAKVRNLHPPTSTD